MAWTAMDLKYLLVPTALPKARIPPTRTGVPGIC